MQSYDGLLRFIVELISEDEQRWILREGPLVVRVLFGPFNYTSSELPIMPFHVSSRMSDICIPAKPFQHVHHIIRHTLSFDGG